MSAKFVYKLTEYNLNADILICVLQMFFFARENLQWYFTWLKAIFQIYREATFQDFEAKNEREPSQSENLFRILKEVFLTFKMLKEFFLNKFCQN